MTNNLKIGFAFVLGAGVGALAIYKYAFKVAYDRADAEIDGFIEAYSNDFDSAEEVVEFVDDIEEDRFTVEPKIAVDRKIEKKAEIQKYHQLVERVQYNTVDEDPEERAAAHENPEEEDMAGIYTIHPDEYNTVDGYGCNQLYYSADNYVLDTDWEVLTEDEIKTCIGRDPEGSFGEWEDDIVYVRNEHQQIDYEILLSMKNKDDIVGGGEEY